MTVPETMARAIGPASMLAAARAASLGSMLVVSLVVARDLGPTGFGRYAFFVGVGSVLVGGAPAGLAALCLRETSRGTVWRRRDLFAAFAVMVSGGALLAAAAGVLRLGFGGLLPAVVAAVVSALVAYVTIRSSMLAGVARFGRAALAESSIGVGALVATTCLSLAGAMTLTTALLAVGVGGASGAVVAGAPPAGEAQATPDLVRRSVPFVLMGLASSGYARLDVVVLAAVTTFGEAGRYAAAFRFLAPITIVTSAFGTVFLTRLVQCPDAAARRRAIRRGQVALVAAVVPVALAGIVLAPLLLRLLFGSEYRDAVVPARILLVSGLPLAVYWPIALALNASDREWLWTSILAAAAAASVLAVTLLGRRSGSGGAAMAWLVVELSLMVVLLRVERRHLVPRQGGA